MDNRPIGIVDSGLGGLAILSAIKQLLPQESLLYLADKQFFPYGNKTAKTITSRLIKIFNFFLQHNCKAVVIACNTITVSSIKFLRCLYNFPIIGTEPAVKPAVEANLQENILVLATPTTVKSSSLKSLINLHDQRHQVRLLACPQLVELIENYRLKLIDKRLKTIFSKQINFSAVVLGCTHYILIKDRIKKHLPPSVIVIEPSLAIAKQLEKVLNNNQLLSNKQTVKAQFFTTKDAKKTTQIASRLWPHSIIFNQCTI